jgi:hypothetical protein
MIALLDSAPRALLLLLLLTLYGAAMRWRWSAAMLLDCALLLLLAWRPSLGLLIWTGALLLIRHVPTLASDVARLLRLDSFDGWTEKAVLFALPALQAYDPLMSREEALEERAPVAPPVHVPAPGIAPVPAESPAGLDIRDAWIVSMAQARDEHGEYLFSANDIFKANGGHRATVLARVKEIQHGAAPAPFRQEDGTTAPAHYPVSKSA